MPGVRDIGQLVRAPGFIEEEPDGSYHAVFFDGDVLRIQLRGSGVGNVAAVVVETSTGVDMLALDRNGSVVFPQNVSVSAGGLRVAAGRINENMTLTNVTTAGAETYTAAQLAGGVITRDPTGAARTDTTDTGTAIEAELPGVVANGDTLLCWVINTADAAEAITIAGGTGVTISNAGQTIAQNESALLLFRRTAANTFTCYIIGA